MNALLKQDLAVARFSAETACKAAPYEEICRLDLGKVAAAEGHSDFAENMLNSQVFNRTDDHMAPIDLPKRTKEVVSTQAWVRDRGRKDPA